MIAKILLGTGHILERNRAVGGEFKDLIGQAELHSSRSRSPVLAAQVKGY